MKQFDALPLNPFAELFFPRIPLSNQSFTYVFIPRDFLRGLFGTYGMDLPKGFASSPFFMIDANDSVPPNIDPSTIAWIGEFISALSYSSCQPTRSRKISERWLGRQPPPPVP